MTLTIGVDIGGTKIAAGLVDAEGTIVDRLRRPTPAEDTDATAGTMAAMIVELAERGDATAVGLGAAGFVSADRSTVLFAPNLPWRDEPLGERLTSLTGLPVVVENDANAAAWAEFRFGAARDAHSALTVTIGTGVGGGVVIDDQLLRGARGFAAEIGHMTVKPNGRLCGCGLHGCWERYGSGSALVLEARETASVQPAWCARMIALAGGDPWAISGMDIARAAAEGDEAALKMFEIIGTWNGRGLADAAALLDPEIVVLAGGVADNGEILRGPVEQSFRTNLTARDFREVPPVVLATLGGDAGIIGAADLARQPPPAGEVADRAASPSAGVRRRSQWIERRPKATPDAPEE